MIGLGFKRSGDSRLQLVGILAFGPKPHPTTCPLVADRPASTSGAAA